MAGDDRPDGPEGEARMTPLERRARWLLRLYPANYRQERGEEIIGTLLEATADNRKWPRARDVGALAVGGLKARAAQNKQRSVGTNLRIAVMVGVALYTAFWCATYMAGAVQGFVWLGLGSSAGGTGWPAAVTALLAGATVVLAWTAPRIGLLAGVLAAAAVIVLAVASHDALVAHFGQVLALAGLVMLSLRARQPSRLWLWLPGVIAVAPFFELGMGDGWLGYWYHFTPELSLLAVAIASILWIAIDARLMVAVLTYCALIAVQMAVMEPYAVTIEVLLPYLLVVAALTLVSGWLLRRQSARAVS